MYLNDILTARQLARYMAHLGTRADQIADELPTLGYGLTSAAAMELAYWAVAQQTRMDGWARRAERDVDVSRWSRMPANDDKRGPAIVKRASKVAERAARELHWGPRKIYRLLLGAFALPPAHAHADDRRPGRAAERRCARSGCADA